MAPGAKIVLVEAKTNNDIDIRMPCSTSPTTTSGMSCRRVSARRNPSSALNADGTRQPGATLAASHRIYAQMVNEGITPFASAGDKGSGQPTCDGSELKLAASSPATDPAGTGVGRDAALRQPADRKGTTTRSSGTSSRRSAPRPVVGSAPTTPGPNSGSSRRPAGPGVPDVAYNAAINHGVLVAWSVTAPLGSFFPLRRHQRRIAKVGGAGRHRRPAQPRPPRRHQPGPCTGCPAPSS